MTGWRGSGPYSNVDPAGGNAGGGGGLSYSRQVRGSVAQMQPGPYATGGGLRQSSAAPLTGFGGVGGPGPGGLIGVNGQ